MIQFLLDEMSLPCFWSNRNLIPTLFVLSKESGSSSHPPKIVKFGQMVVTDAVFRVLKIQIIGFGGLAGGCFVPDSQAANTISFKTNQESTFFETFWPGSSKNLPRKAEK